MIVWILILRLVGSELCEPSQVGDGRCDPACMVPTHSFDSVLPRPSDCAGLCTCPHELKSNGNCDDECNSWECEWDAGECGECVAGCQVSMLGNGECNPECNYAECNWDAGECVNADSPAEYYVATEENSLFEVVQSLWSPWNRVWLTREVILLQSDSDFPQLLQQPGLKETAIATLLCLDRSVAGCQVHYSTIQLTALHPLFRIAHSVTFTHVRFSGYFRLQAQFPDTYCPFTEKVEGEWVNDRSEAVSPTVEQSVCAEYSSHSFLAVGSGGVLTLEDVKFEGFRQQLRAIVTTECGDVALRRVDFANSMAAQGDGGLIVLESMSSGLCGSLEYTEGRVRLLNNGYEYRDSMALSGFLNSRRAANITISGVLFEYNFLGSSLTSLISLRDVGILTVKDCTLQWNMGGMSSGFDVQSALDRTEVDSLDGSTAHIALFNVTFHNNTSLGCTCLCVSFQGLQRSVLLSTLTLANNYSPQGTLINISAKAVSVLEGSGGLSALGAVSIRTHTAVSLRSIHCSNNQNFVDGGSPCVDISLQSPSEVEISDSQFTENAGLSASAVLAVGTQSLVIARVQVLRNTAKASCGGVLVSPHPAVASAVTVRDSEFAGNAADSFGALAVIDLAGVLMGNRVGVAWLLVDGCTFTENRTNSQGSSITVYKFVQLSQNSLVTRSSFTKNSSNRGPGVYCEYETGVLTVSACKFTKNSSLKGSAILAHHYPPSDVPSIVTVNDCTFAMNTGSPAIAIDGWELPNVVHTSNNLYDRNDGGAVSSSTGVLTDRNSTYVSNTIKSSGAVKLGSSNATMHNCSWRSNVGKRNGGVFFLSGRSVLEVYSSTISNNSAAGIGGVLYADEASTARFAGTEVERNTAGSQGAFAYVLASALLVENCSLRYNSAGHSFLAVISEGLCELRNSVVANNTAGAGCGLSASSSALTITGCSFSSQRAQQGAFVFSGKRSSIDILSTSFVNGSAALQGGAIYCVMGCQLTVSHSLFAECSAGNEGGAVFLESSSGVISDTRLQSIATGSNGGAINFHSGTAALSKCAFDGMSGAALLGMHVTTMAVSDSEFSSGTNSRGGLFYCSQCAQLRIANSHFTAGRSDSGGAVCIDAPLVGECSCEVVNNSVTDSHANVGGGLRIENVNCSLSGNVIANNTAPSGSGGGLNVACESGRNCQYEIAGNFFIHNSADIQGGAVSWQAATSPSFSANSFQGNLAFYGNDIASTATTIAAVSEDGRLLGEGGGLHLTDIASGHVHTKQVVLGLFDDIGQLVKTADGLMAEISVPSNSGILLGGDIKCSSVGGVLRFSSLQLIGEPGSTQPALVEVGGLQPLALTLSFRYCALGESLQNLQCLLCPANTYSLDSSKPCFMCPAEAVCYGNFSMVPKSGYWRPSNSTDRFFRCFNPDACIGSSDSFPLSLTGDCAAGYTGNLCQSCAEGYSRSGKNDCSFCPDRSVNAAVTATISLAVLTSLGLLIYFSISNATKPKSLTAVHLKIMINYTQLVVIVASINIRWPTFIDRLLEGQDKVGSATEQLSSYICLANEIGYTGPSVYLTSRLAAVLPAFLMVLTSLFWLLLSRFRRVTFLREKLFCSWILTLFTLHPTLTKETMSMFACIELEPGKLWLINEMSVSCWEGDHLRELLMVTVPSLVVWVFGLPLLALAWLIAARRTLAMRKTALSMGFMYRGYGASSYYWEFVVIVRKVLAIALVVALSAKSVQVQSLAVLACLLLFFYLQVLKKPFFQDSLNWLESKSIFVSIITIYAGLYFTWQDLGKGHTDFTTSVCLFVVLVVANAYFLLAWLRHAGPSLYQVLKDIYSKVWRRDYVRSHVPALETPEEEEHSRIVGISHTLVPPNATREIEVSHSCPG